MTELASAPGKVMLAGEYAVLDGGTAVLVAVDRRARAHRGAAAPPSEFLRAAADVLARDVSPTAAAAIADLRIDTRGFQQDGVKLGLGSSAAATVAAVAAALVEAGSRPAEIDRERVAAIAAKAHAEAQAKRGAAGSGADVAACAHGGVIAFARGQVTRLELPAGLRLDFAWTRSAADTATLVAAVTAARGRPGVEDALRAIAAAAAALAEAMTPDAHAAETAETRAEAAVRAFAQAADATAWLARATGVALVPAEVAALQARLPAGAVAKTTGAGGGDVVVVASTAAVERNRIEAAIVEVGLWPLALALDRTGVDFVRARA